MRAAAELMGTGTQQESRKDLRPQMAIPALMNATPFQLADI